MTRLAMGGKCSDAGWVYGCVGVWALGVGCWAAASSPRRHARAMPPRPPAIEDKNSRRAIIGEFGINLRMLVLSIEHVSFERTVRPFRHSRMPSAGIQFSTLHW